MSAQTSLLGARTLLIAALLNSAGLHAQMPFYTDDTSITETGKFHVEAFEELDGLRSSRYPDLRQLTTNIKLNFSPLRHLEFDMDAPYIRIARASGFESASGLGDADLGAKWILRETPPDSDLAAFAGEPVRRITDR